MKAFKIDKTQQKKIAAFFKEETSYFPNHVLLKFVSILLTAISFLLLIIPRNAWEPDEKMVRVYGFLLFAMGIFTYASKYAAFTEPLTKKTVSISALTRYLPVNRMQLTLFRIGKILKPCLICTVVVICLRIPIAFASNAAFSVWDVLLPVLLMILWPVAVEFTRY